MQEQAIRNSEPLSELAAAVGELAGRIARWTDKEERLETQVPGLWLFRRVEKSAPISVMYEPSICLIAQGAKHILVGNDAFDYDPGHYLITSVHMPTVAQIVDASQSSPYLGLKLNIDLKDVSRLMVDCNLPASHSQKSDCGMAVGELTLPLVNAFNRLIDLQDSVQDIGVLAPVIQREILYRLLVGDQGARLRQIATIGSRSNQLARAIDWIQKNYRQPLRINELANEIGMGTSTFHNHFRQLTAMSPLQYQKQLRLQEARRLLLVGEVDASSAAYEVGYDSPSQFNREYHRLFGAPPLRDIKTLREAAKKPAS